MFCLRVRYLFLICVALTLRPVIVVAANVNGLYSALDSAAQTSADAQTERGRWCGEAKTKTRLWDVCLDTLGAHPTLDVPSLWVAKQLIAVERKGPDVTFPFPWKLGSVVGRFKNGRFVGRIEFTNGTAAHFALKRVVPQRITTRPLSVVNEGVKIAAELSLPSTMGHERVPAVVILHGGGDSSRADSPGYRFWADYLPRHGYAALIYDKRGNGLSTGNWRGVGFEERAADVQALLASLRQQPEIDPTRIGVLAVSQGCWVATLLAFREPSLAFVVQLSGPAVSPFEADTYAQMRDAATNGFDSAATEQYLDLWRLLVEAIRRGDDTSWDTYDKAAAAASKQSWVVSSGFKPTKRTSWFATWYRRVADFDPAPVLSRVPVPMLWLYGAVDSQSDVARNLAVLEHLSREDGRAFEVHVFPAAGHGLLVPTDKLSHDDPPLTIAPGFFEQLLAWMDARVGRNRAGCR